LKRGCGFLASSRIGQARQAHQGVAAIRSRSAAINGLMTLGCPILNSGLSARLAVAVALTCGPTSRTPGWAPASLRSHLLSTSQQKKSGCPRAASSAPTAPFSSIRVLINWRGKDPAIDASGEAWASRACPNILRTEGVIHRQPIVRSAKGTVGWPMIACRPYMMMMLLLGEGRNRKGCGHNRHRAEYFDAHGGSPLHAATLASESSFRKFELIVSCIKRA
jgi:hypothetical protein